MNSIIRVISRGFLLTVWGVLTTAGLASGQTPPTQTDTTQPPATAEVEDGPKLKAYRELMSDINEKEQRINQLYANIPVGFPEAQSNTLAEIEALEKNVVELRTQVTRAVVDAYLEAPNQNMDVNRAVAIALNRSLSPESMQEKFDPATALEIATAMINQNVAPPAVLYSGFRAAYALERFDVADQMLARLKTANQNVDPRLENQLTITKAAWQRELELREKERVADDLPRVEFDTTAGRFTVELFEDQAPHTVANFITLVEAGYYDKNDFHLVKPGILAQAGCPLGNATGNPGYFIPCECYRDDARKHFAGSLSMLAPARDQGGGIFFITEQPNNLLDGKYTVFGRILGELDPVYQLNTVDATLTRTGAPDASRINKATVIRKRPHPYVPEKLEIQRP